jgi:hypothetical protein
MAGDRKKRLECDRRYQRSTRRSDNGGSLGVCLSQRAKDVYKIEDDYDDRGDKTGPRALFAK